MIHLIYTDKESLLENKGTNSLSDVYIEVNWVYKAIEEEGIC